MQLHVKNVLQGGIRVLVERQHVYHAFQGEFKTDLGNQTAQYAQSKPLQMCLKCWSAIHALKVLERQRKDQQCVKSAKQVNTEHPVPIVFLVSTERLSLMLPLVNCVRLDGIRVLNDLPRVFPAFLDDIKT